MRALLATAAILAASLLAACDIADPEPPGSSPSRPLVSLPKEIATASSIELVGAWRCRELDPYPDQPAVTTTLVLAADGSMTSEALLPLAGTMPDAVDLLMRATGDWRVEDDRLITTGTEVGVMAADGADDDLSPAMRQVAAGLAERAGDDAAEIYRITASELVMRGLAADAPAVACLRQA